MVRSERLGARCGLDTNSGEVSEVKCFGTFLSVWPRCVLLEERS
jgi:hypothetical protein